MDGHVSKPIQTTELLTAIETALSGAALGGTPSVQGAEAA
jgi:hypothetical protein